MKKKYPVIDIKKTGQNIKHIMQMRRMTVKDVQEFLELSTPQSIYHWFDGRNLPTVDNLYALSELFRVPVDALIIGNREFEYGYLEGAAYQRVIIYYQKIMQLKAG
ncbi:DNA-binding helix-turn-helix protein [Marvinbryantia formatexigens DSM 14469]|uniref:DNA-binding helix-turn-helix protein n=1 Tax=Marvinbryantia formatexigens DSM 14469 TaxID=478749 RepID=C6LHX4_9FIRM|nr:helix-turn-helix domain-containing protein [Marvinbryantia formatexigens]EET59864.1 DNA-binding helix-turn-helix protein [Marvinbryantia formatexigens DSM 14469]UWO23943.1 helix-turn-helix domain-containing protein [Marvinbryantia formatexigens DSM 14469]SDH10929.1 Helix-turn-helix domain-containing protein [Marvinbryantia formatexigens]